MKNFLKTLFFKLSYNEKLRKVARKVFVYFPGIKAKLKELRDGSYIPKNITKVVYKGDLLEKIKTDIQSHIKDEVL